MFGNNKGFANITINGRKIHCSGSNMVISNGKIIVDGNVVQDSLSGDIHVEIHGNVAHIQCGGSVTVHGNAGSIDCGNSCTVDGDVVGDIDAGSHVSCGNVTGNVDAGSHVHCDNVSGDVDAGSSVRYGRL